jgi:hypothetical protein
MSDGDTKAVSFSSWGDRSSIDFRGWHTECRIAAAAFRCPDRLNQNAMMFLRMAIVSGADLFRIEALTMAIIQGSGKRGLD